VRETNHITITPNLSVASTASQQPFPIPPTWSASDIMAWKVVAIIGCGGIGLAIARRLGVGRQLWLADYSETLLVAAQRALGDEGYSVQTTIMDVFDYASVSKFAEAAAAAGALETVVLTAGLSPTAGNVSRIYKVNLLGTANVINAFLDVAKLGMSLTCISSMAGHMGPGLASDLERHLGTAPRDELLSHSGLTIDDAESYSAGRAYGLSKRGNLLRVRAAVGAWGRRGARINTFSPDVISTGMGQQEIAGGAGKFIASSPAERLGIPQDIVNAVAFLASPESSFITGSDLLVDGGVVSSFKWKN
jgi:NAD(P)-dependent dehydrogenase (short-subunit alcohol dehydrogenase family)